eukprot:TRINITY_DN19344_c0_g1_i1.p1 TRINITY_DN19344_c0_g1~~TRINITY_DN19344_c0_g1_i1.p1  ORF type:complete len:947 (+),score=114.45 TRINITY_DN19344_c0_g1_i1:109-2949(+)
MAGEGGPFIGAWKLRPTVPQPNAARPPSQFAAQGRGPPVASPDITAHQVWPSEFTPVEGKRLRCTLCHMLVADSNACSHMDQTHRNAAAATAYWEAVSDLNALHPEMTPQADAAWEDAIKKNETTRQTKAETKRRRNGVHLLTRALGKDFKLLPFGSTVIGTGEGGASDTDISVLYQGASLCYDLKGLHNRDVQRLEEMRPADLFTCEGEYGITVVVDRRNGNAAIFGMHAQSIMACWARLLKYLRTHHPRAGSACYPVSIEKPSESALVGYVERTLQKIFSADATINAVLGTAVPIVRMGIVADVNERHEGTLQFRTSFDLRQFVNTYGLDDQAAVDSTAQPVTKPEGHTLILRPGYSSQVVVSLCEELGEGVSAEMISLMDGTTRCCLVFSEISAYEYALENIGRCKEVALPSHGALIPALRFYTTGTAIDALVHHHTKGSPALRGLYVRLVTPPSLVGMWDITARPQYGPRNSALFRAILQSASEPALVACCMVKKWGKLHTIADARNGWMSSYALVMLFCFYLQQRNEAKYVRHSDITLSVDLTHSPIPKVLDAAERLKARDLVIGFFQFYTNYDWNRVVTFRVPPEVVQSMQGLGYTHAASYRSLEHNRRLHVYAWMGIEDPYEDINVARRMSYPKLQFFKGLLKGTYLSLGCQGSLSETLDILFTSGPPMTFEGDALRLIGDDREAGVQERVHTALQSLWGKMYVPPIKQVPEERPLDGVVRVQPPIASTNLQQPYQQDQLSQQHPQLQLQQTQLQPQLQLQQTQLQTQPQLQLQQTQLQPQPKPQLQLQQTQLQSQLHPQPQPQPQQIAQQPLPSSVMYHMQGLVVSPSSPAIQQPQQAQPLTNVVHHRPSQPRNQGQQGQSVVYRLQPAVPSGEVGGVVPRPVEWASPQTHHTQQTAHNGRGGNIWGQRGLPQGGAEPVATPPSPASPFVYVVGQGVK